MAAALAYVMIGTHGLLSTHSIYKTHHIYADMSGAFSCITGSHAKQLFKVLYKLAWLHLLEMLAPVVTYVQKYLCMHVAMALSTWKCTPVPKTGSTNTTSKPPKTAQTQLTHLPKTAR